MFSPPLRLALIFLAGALAVMELSQQQPSGFLFLGAAALLAWGYFRHGTVYAACAAYRRGQLERARKLLARVRDPGALTAQDRAYYHWLSGILASGTELSSARKSLEEALEGALRTQNDRSLAHCHLAIILAQQGEKDGARGHLSRARELGHRPEVAELIRQVEERLEQPECTEPAGTP